MSQPRLNFYKLRFWSFVGFAIVTLFLIGALRHFFRYLGAF